MAASGMLDEVATALEALERVLQHGSDLAGYRVPYNFEQEERVLRFTMPLPGNTPITRLNVCRTCLGPVISSCDIIVSFDDHELAFAGIEWLQQAATRHHGQALLHLAKLYESGHRPYSLTLCLAMFHLLNQDVALAERYNRSARALDPTMAVASNAGSAHGSATPLSRSAVTSARATPSHDAAARNSPAVRPSHARRPETAETARQLEFTPEDTAEAMDEDLLDAVKQRAMMILGVGAAVFGLVVMHMRR
ncbi:uncharacterized protein MONBRDRAFT_5121 [Monosiga brevicollis MX1]|uniref:Uncharacterized protein n=1 Tax=Monosiga brevicollis TaxID=81824 RepID=A9UPZ6_MONBE|nr:uncharacterized protein MONBRDRAFT_5121 [Monosiga brevicollis MX1]EDQ92959.1 predicted protein [Monosiga brevicollis MX1]|eukprot:XP_001742721.1 hypothetical protein [Monosiga brevicollis MX1]